MKLLLLLFLELPGLVFAQRQPTFQELAQARGTINELPMFGNQAKTAQQLAIDQQFIADVLQQYATPQAAANAYLNRGWKYLESGYPIVAIKRFNQAWLLDSTSADVYFGFSAYLHQQGQAAEAERFMVIARRHDTANRSLMRYYGNLGALQEARGTARPLLPLTNSCGS